MLCGSRSVSAATKSQTPTLSPAHSRDVTSCDITSDKWQVAFSYCNCSRYPQCTLDALCVCEVVTSKNRSCASPQRAELCVCVWSINSLRGTSQPLNTPRKTNKQTEMLFLIVSLREMFFVYFICVETFFSQPATVRPKRDATFTEQLNQNICILFCCYWYYYYWTISLVFCIFLIVN